MYTDRGNSRDLVTHTGATVLYIAGRGPSVNSGSNSARAVVYHATPKPSMLYMMFPGGRENISIFVSENTIRNSIRTHSAEHLFEQLQFHLCFPQASDGSNLIGGGMSNEC